MAAHRVLVSAGSARLSAARPEGLLPTPPDDHEKYSYVVRRTWLLSLTSFLGFVCVFYSQVDSARHGPWIWLFSPCCCCPRWAF